MQDDSTSINNLIEQVLKEGLGLSDEPLQIQRSHCSLRFKLLAFVQPRSIVACFLNYKTKDMVLCTAWQKKKIYVVGPKNHTGQCPPSTYILRKHQ